MWKLTQRMAAIGMIAGGILMWLCSNSVPDTLVKADSNLAENLRWAGLQNPPPALATSAADHVGFLAGTMLVLLGVGVLTAWALERRSPLLVVDLREAPDVPDQHSVALWVVVRNRSRKTLKNLLARLVQATPELAAFPLQALPPFTLATKTRLERLRNFGEPLPAGGFTVRAGCEKQIEVAFLHKDVTLEWHVQHEAGLSTFLLMTGYVLTVEIGGLPRRVTARIQLEVINEETGEWKARLV